MKNEIKKFLEGKEEATLKEIYGAFSEKSKDGIRGTINLMVKKNELTRVRKGIYSLQKEKEENKEN